MRFVLLDTQAYLWYVTRDPRLTTVALEAIGKAEIVFLSVVSLWEIGIKVALDKLEVDVELRRLVNELPAEKAIIVLTVEPRHILRMASLPHHHRDPFDRMIVAQALEEGIAVVGSDRAFDAYGVRRLF